MSAAIRPKMCLVQLRSFFVTITAGQDETSEGNPENSKRDAVDVAPSIPALKTKQRLNQRLKTKQRQNKLNGGTNHGGTSTTWRGSSGVRHDARQPDGSHSLSTGHIANRTENGNYSSRSMCQKNTTMHILGQWK